MDQESACDEIRSESKAPAAPGWGRAGPVALLATAIPVAGAVAVPSLGLLLAPWLREMGIAGAVIFTIAFTILGALALAPTYSTAIIAGWTFGFALGFPAVVIGTVAGATLCYLFARHVAGRRVRSVFADHPRWEVVRRALAEEKPLKTLWIVLLMRLSPVLPFGTTNVLMSTCGVSLAIYVVGTMLGLMPRMGLVAMAAAGAERIDFKTAQSWWMLAGGLVATGICIAALAMIGKRALHRATSARHQIGPGSAGSS